MITLCNTCIEDKYINEKLTFIVEHPNLQDEKEYEYSREFAKSLGFRSDCVGGVSDIVPTFEMLQKMLDRAKTEGVNVRAYYEINISEDYPCEWYWMIGNPKGGHLAASEWDKYDGYPIGKVKAYSVPDNIRFTRIGCTDFLMLREDIVRSIENENYKGMEFVWCPDKGRYRSLQYYQSFPQYILPHWYQCTHKKLTENIASHLTENAKLLAREAKEVWLELPMAVDTRFISQDDFVATYPADSHDNRVLVRKRVRDHLVEKKLAKPNDFEPVIACEGLTRENAFPLVKRESCKYTPIPEKVRSLIEREYKRSLEKEKPIRIATEKDALSKLRRVKKEEKDMFGKKANENLLCCATDQRLIPYYKVANGGALSDEYLYFSIEDSIIENEKFWALQDLECSEIIPNNAKVFGATADGESIILLPDGTVVRYQQGEVQINVKWNDLPSFFVEAIEE